LTLIPKPPYIISIDKKGNNMDKYKNTDGIELSYTNKKDIHQELVKEVIGEAIKILSTYNGSSKISMNMAIGNTKKFLKTNFNIGDK